MSPLLSSALLPKRKPRKQLECTNLMHSDLDGSLFERFEINLGGMKGRAM